MGGHAPCVLLSLEHVQSPYRKENIDIEGYACLVNPLVGTTIYALEHTLGKQTCYHPTE